MFYQWIRPMLFLLPAETAHHLGLMALRALSAVPWLCAWTRRRALRSTNTAHETGTHGVGDKSRDNGVLVASLLRSQRPQDLLSVGRGRATELQACETKRPEAVELHDCQRRRRESTQYRGLDRALGVSVEFFGRRLDSRVGVGAGLDKDGVCIRGLHALGFGFVEIGTVTAKPQPGNPKPRLFRLPRDHALLNRMGFNNLGAVAVARRLQDRPSEVVLGINIGKSKVTSEEDAPADYAESTRLLARYADYLVINVSSPNTPGLRNLQSVDKLRPILQAVHRAAKEATDRSVPILVKIAPDLADEDVLALTDLALEEGLSGIVATNTTISRDGLLTDRSALEGYGAGGISGRPLKARALQVLRLVHERSKDRLILIASGGIETTEDVAERLAAGASLVQVYSALIYQGPSLPGRLARGT